VSRLKTVTLGLVSEEPFSQAHFVSIGCLLIGRNALLVLNLCFHGLYSVRAFNFQCDGFARESLNENLQTRDKTDQKQSEKSWISAKCDDNQSPERQ